MTTPAPGAARNAAIAAAALHAAALHAAAAEAGLDVLASACWPGGEADIEVTPLAGFIESAFSPLVAEVSGRVLGQRARRQPARPGPAATAVSPAPDLAAGDAAVTAIVVVTATGDVTSAVRVAAAVDAGKRVAPLLFFQSVPNAVAGYLAARWHLTGPVVCVSDASAAAGAAALLLADADADEALIVSADLEVTGGTGDRAAAILVTGPAGRPGIDP
jgi:hypothetical protein